MTTRDYEAMFLLDNTRAGEDFEGSAALVDQILEKHGAELIIKEKWDERKLAYEIKGHRRATYYLVYFRAPTPAIEEINGDIRLSDLVLRHMVMQLDEPIETHVEKRAEEKERLAEESRKASLSSWGDRKRRPSGGGGREDRSDGPADGPGDMPASVPADVPADVPAAVPAAVPADAPAAVPAAVPADGPKIEQVEGAPATPKPAAESAGDSE